MNTIEQYLNGLSIIPDPSIDRQRFAKHYDKYKEIWDRAFLFLKQTNFKTVSLRRIELGEKRTPMWTNFLPIVKWR
jgi:hypothetical protein